MSFAELLLVAIGLSMDAFAVAVCRGLEMRRIDYRQALLIAVFFGGFQALMPVAGYLLGAGFEHYISSFDHWIAFLLLGLIGANMIRESRGGAEHVDSSFRPRSMLPLAVATSIDALAVGVTFAFLRVEIGPAVSCIGVITFLLSAAGVYIGGAFGDRFQGKAELAGGVILVLMGSKILLEHLGFLG